MKLQFDGLQQLGRALMLPIAVLPIAGLLLRIGQPDLLDWPATAAAGKTIFDHLGLLFAVGVGVGLARENHGAAGLAALVGYIVTSAAAATLLKTTPDGDEVWFSHKLADAVSCRTTKGNFHVLDAVLLGTNARPNHVEFVSNAKGRVVYAASPERFRAEEAEIRSRFLTV